MSNFHLKSYQEPDYILNYPQWITAYKYFYLFLNSHFKITIYQLPATLNWTPSLIFIIGIQINK